jgi:hypothetical protein
MRKSKYEDLYLQADTYEKLLVVFNILDKLHQSYRKRYHTISKKNIVLEAQVRNLHEQEERKRQLILRMEEETQNMLQEHSIELEKKDEIITTLSDIIGTRYSGWENK